jgi:hypothetical protein
MDQFARTRTGVGANSRSVNSLTKMSNIDQQPAVRSSKENGLSTGEGLRPSFIGCHGGIASGRSEPIDPSNIGSGRTRPIFPEAVRLEPYRAPTSSPTRSFISEPIYLSEDCALHQDRHRHALCEASVAERRGRAIRFIFTEILNDAGRGECYRSADRTAWSDVVRQLATWLPPVSKASVGKFLSRKNDRAGRAHSAIKDLIMQEHQITQAVSFKDRLLRVAAHAREQADTMLPGKQRDALMARARQAETTAQIDDWLASPGPKPSPHAKLRATPVAMAKTPPGTS